MSREEPRSQPGKPPLEGAEVKLRSVAVLLIWASFGAFQALRAETVEELNLGFEQEGEKPSKPKAWTVSGDGFATDAPGYQVGLDEAESKSGKRSLRMKVDRPGQLRQRLPDDSRECGRGQAHQDQRLDQDEGRGRQQGMPGSGAASTGPAGCSPTTTWSHASTRRGRSRPTTAA